MPKVSVIVPVYNVEKYISKCIDSILNQTYTDWELILVDDGSPDRSGTICDRYAQNNRSIKVIHKKNGGVSSARNAGLKEFNSEYVMFVDADDYLTPNALENAVAVANEHPEIELFTFNYNIVCTDQVSRTDFPAGIVSGWTFIESMLNYKGTGSVWGKLFRRKNLRDCFFNSMLKLGEDTEFIIDYLIQSEGEVLVSNLSIYNYVLIPNSASHCKDNLPELTMLNVEFIHKYNHPELENISQALAYYIASNVIMKLSSLCRHYESIECDYLRSVGVTRLKRFNVKVRFLLWIFEYFPEYAIRLASIYWRR